MMNELAPVIARIALRYGSGALVTYGFMNADAGAAAAVDPDLALLVGAAIGALTESWYAIVKQQGGKT